MSVYNSENFLLDSINSILSQTHKNFEFIIINDGSNDNSKKILLFSSILEKSIKIETFAQNF